MKKLTMVAAAFAVALSLKAAEDTVGGYTWTYQINGDKAEIGNGGSWAAAVSPDPTGAITIPSTLGGKTVTSIGWSAFYGCSGLTSVTIPDSVTNIGYSAFHGCNESLFDTTTISGVKLVDGWAVDYTESLSGDLVLTGIRGIGDSAFEDCDGLTSVTIPDSVTSIGYRAFYGCSGLTSVTIPDSVTSIGDYAFSGCTGLADGDGFVIVRGVLYDYVGEATEITIPDSVTSIGEEAFWGCDRLTSVTIPDSVTSIGEFAFEGCTGLESVTIGNGVTSIGAWAFSACDGLTSVEIPDSVTSIGNNAFYLSGLESVEIPGSVTSIGEEAFMGCSGLTGVTIPDGVTSIGEGAFGWCNGLTNVVFEGDMAAIAIDLESVFAGTPWLEAYLEGLPAPENDGPDGAVELTGESGSTEGTNVKATADADDPLALSFESEATVWWKWTAGTDGEITFDTIGSNFDTVMGVYTRDGDGFETVAENNDGGVDTTSSVTFETTAGTTYYIAVGGYGGESGEIALNWYRYQLVIDEVGILSGYLGTLPEELDIPEGVTDIASWVFDDNFDISTINLPSTLRSIGEYAFAWSSLETVNGLSDTVEVAPSAFWGTRAEASFPFRLLIKDNVLLGFFGACPATLDIPEGVVEIAESAFDSDYHGYNIKVGEDTDEEWEWHTTLDSLTSVTIPASVERIGIYAFYGCTNLASVSVANPDVAIEWTAFIGCGNLASIGLEKTGCVQTGWRLTFDAPVYALYLIEDEYGNRLECDRGNPVYAAGETLEFPVDDLSFLDGISVTNADGVVGWLESQEEKENSSYTYWDTVPVWVTAVWEEAVPTPSTPELFEAEPVDAFEGNAQYTGWLRDADGNLVGTLTVKAAKANKKSGASKLTATVVMLDTGKKLVFNGTAAAGQLANVTLTGKSGTLNVTLTDDSVTGTFGAYTVEAAKNVFASKASDDKASAALVGKKTWTVTLASAKGYTPFTLAVAAKGKAKVTGVLPDGTKVSVSAQAVVGDGGRWAVPVMYAKKSKFGFVAWFAKGADGQTSFTGVSDLTPLRGPKNAVTEWEAVTEACGPAGSLAAGAHALTVSAEDVAAIVPGVNADLLPSGEAVTVAKGKWTLA
ncbi:MAG: leucine-rich repeat domain-containing protein, partial [Kiritimatiellae bacterium]|nr:leucine-rich repeat domain-containing protein [Kiritimatiellia bacterium]